MTELPDDSRYLVVVAPHTSGWDLLLGLLFTFASGIRPNWIGKDDIFRWPLGSLMRWLGGIPVNRRSKNNFVDQIVALYKARNELIVAITPAGTRGDTSYWRTGFYYIALGAEVPIALGFIDYGARRLGIQGTLWPTGNLEADMRVFQEFYAGMRGKYPERQQPVRTRPGAIEAS